eukprot:scaffold76589_cov60-Phaeocystis_antarctica.AAC.1
MHLVFRKLPVAVPIVAAHDFGRSTESLHAGRLWLDLNLQHVRCHVLGLGGSWVTYRLGRAVAACGWTQGWFRTYMAGSGLVSGS